MCAKVCERWKTVKCPEDDTFGIEVWEIVKPLMGTMYSILTSARVSADSQEGRTVIRCRWGKEDMTAGMKFLPHVDVSVFENAVVRMSRFEGWACRHIEHAMYEVLHTLPQATSHGTSAITRSSATAVEGSPTCCPGHPDRHICKPAASESDSWTVTHYQMHKVTSNIFKWRDSHPHLQVDVIKIVEVPTSLIQNCPMQLPDAVAMRSQKEYFYDCFEHRAIVSFVAPSRTELDTVIAAGKGQHTLELCVDGKSVPAEANGRFEMAAEVLMKSLAMMTWPFTEVVDVEKKTPEEAGSGSRATLDSYITRNKSSKNVGQQEAVSPAGAGGQEVAKKRRTAGGAGGGARRKG